MWGLLRLFIIGRLFGGGRRGGAPGRKGCGCMPIIAVVLLIVVAFAVLRSCGSGGVGYGW